jgi:hypothetical protein
VTDFFRQGGWSDLEGGGYINPLLILIGIYTPILILYAILRSKGSTIGSST